MSEAALSIGSIGIVGGGKGGLEILTILSKCFISNICFIVDVNTNASALVHAREIGVPTYCNIDEALQRSKVDFIIEATGSLKVLNIIKEKVNSKETEVISSKAALMLFTIIHENRAVENQEICTDITRIVDHINTSILDIQKSITSVSKISLDLDILALNARIEAAHAGEYGSGFAIVANEVKNSAKTMQNMVSDISDINDNIHIVSSEIHHSLGKLCGRDSNEENFESCII